MPEHEELETVPAWPAFVDLLAAATLLLVSVVAVLVYMGQARSGGLATERERLIAFLARDTAAGGFSLEPDPQFVRIIIQEATTFPRGVHALDSLRQPGRDALRRIGEMLSHDSIRALYREIRILGNTDEDPYAPGGFSNWELSAARAAVVARYLDEVVGVDPCRLSATGLGPYHPARPARGAGLADLGAEQRKERDRRIEIEIVPAMARTDAFGRRSDERRCDAARRAPARAVAGR